MNLLTEIQTWLFLSFVADCSGDIVSDVNGWEWRELVVCVIQISHFSQWQLCDHCVVSFLGKISMGTNWIY